MLLRALLAVLAATFLWALPASAQQRVDCGNGSWCPANHACLVGGQCGFVVDGPPGGTRTSDGNWCDPGYYESRNRPGRCIPPGYTECGSGACQPGTTCNHTNETCEGGSGSGPICGGQQCMAGRVCTAHGTCMNPQLHHDCGNGTICTHASACELPRGCVYVSPQRFPQQRW